MMLVAGNDNDNDNDNFIDKLCRVPYGWLWWLL